MTYPKREGLEFFIHDTDMSEDSKIKILSGRHGLVGFAVYVRLLEMIYKERGYFLYFGNEESELFAIDNRINDTELRSILETCFFKDLFDRAIYEKYNILTSERIQKNFFRSCKRRAIVRYFKELFMISDRDVIPPNIELAFYTLNSNPSYKYDDAFLIDQSYSNDVHFYSKNIQNEQNEQAMNNDSVCTNDDNVNANDDNVHANDDNDNIGAQSKNKSKNKSKSKNKNVRDLYRSKFDQFWNAYDKKVGRKPTLQQWRNLELEDINQILLFVPKYVQATPDPQFRKNPLTFLSQRAWEDEIIERKENGKNNGIQRSNGTKFLDELNEKERKLLADLGIEN